MSPTEAIALEAPLVASPNQAMKALLVSRSTLYSLSNAGELESYTEGRSRRITVNSITAYVKRRLEQEQAARRSRIAA
jgi:excisionase family DNA binding protein